MHVNRRLGRFYGCLSVSGSKCLFGLSGSRRKPNEMQSQRKSNLEIWCYNGRRLRLDLAYLTPGKS